MKTLIPMIIIVLSLSLSGCSSTQTSNTALANLTAEMTHDLCGPILMHKKIYGAYPSTINDLAKPKIDFTPLSKKKFYKFHPKGLTIPNSDKKIILINQNISHQDSYYCIASSPTGQLEVGLFKKQSLIIHKQN